MYSENGIMVDFAEIGELVDAADVFVVGFGNFPERLLVDTRSNEHESPLVQVVEPTASARQRLSWIRRRRPSFEQPEAFSFVPWPHSPSFMVETAIWDRIQHRVDADVDPYMRAQCEQALSQLKNLDLAASIAVLKGENCVTLWPHEEED